MFRILVLALLFTFLLIPVALADVGSVDIPWGDWLAHIIDVLLPTVLTLLSGVATYVVGAYVPPWLRALGGAALQRRINEVLEKAVLSAVAQTKGAVIGKRLSVPVGIEVLRKALQYAVNVAPDLVKHAASDDINNLIKMLLARMEQFGIAPQQLDPTKVTSKVVPPEAKKTIDHAVTGGKKFDFGATIAKQLGK